jgi:hypothetical protein
MENDKIPAFLIIHFLSLAIWLSLLATVFAQTVPTIPHSKPADPLSIETLNGPKRDSSTDRISQDLMNMYRVYQARQRGEAGELEKEETQSPHPLQISDGFVAIDVIASKNAEILKADLEALGLKKSALFGRVVSGLLPIAEIPKLSSLESLRFARPSFAQTHNIPGSLNRKKIR